MLEITITKDLDRINRLLSIDNIGQIMAQYDNEPFVPTDDGLLNYCIISENNKDVGLFIIEIMSIKNHFTIHTAFIKTFRGAGVYIASKMFIDLMKNIFKHATLWACPPCNKPQVIKMAERAGFKLYAIIPNAIATGDKTNPKFVDQAVMIQSWNNT